MAMVINTNIGAINATRLMDQTSRDAATAAERLTSGMRINGASDDAAGMAIATKMESQIRGTDMAVRHANDGISLVQTMDGATEEAVSMMQRMRELAVQSTSGTYTNNDRAQMDKEYEALSLEIKRIGQTTEFNDVKILNSGAATNIQVDWQDTSNGQIAINKYDLQTLGGSVDTKGISTVAAAASSIAILDKKISAVGSQRAEWGAASNRLEHTINNLQNVNENMVAAQSRIKDADFAVESANLAKTQVLQQAGMSMLAKANQAPQNVIQLLS